MRAKFVMREVDRKLVAMVLDLLGNAFVRRVMRRLDMRILRFWGDPSCVNPGDDKDRVMVVMGSPGDRQFQGDHEVWQYCQAGARSGYHDYRMVWSYHGEDDRHQLVQRPHATVRLLRPFSAGPLGGCPGAPIAGRYNFRFKLDHYRTAMHRALDLEDDSLIARMTSFEQLTTHDRPLVMSFVLVWRVLRDGEPRNSFSYSYDRA
jgi:hypothetical protein